MIGAGLVHLPRARRHVWVTAIAGLTVSQLISMSPAMSATAATPDATVGRHVLTACGGGVSAVNVTLPAGFSPLTATNSELVANELPARPSGRLQAAAWRRFVTGLLPAARSRCALVRVPAGGASLSVLADHAVVGKSSVLGDVGTPVNVATLGSAHVTVLASNVTAAPGMVIGDAGPSMVIGDAAPAMVIGDSAPGMVIGDAANGIAGTTAPSSQVVSFNDAYGTWRVARPARGTFAGLALGRGSSAVQPLIEAGSAGMRGAGGSRPVYSLWWRVIPRQGSRQRVSLLVHRGDTVFAHIRILHGKALITVRDETSGAGGTYVIRLRLLAAS